MIGELTHSILHAIIDFVASLTHHVTHMRTGRARLARRELIWHLPSDRRDLRIGSRGDCPWKLGGHVSPAGSAI